MFRKKKFIGVVSLVLAMAMFIVACGAPAANNGGSTTDNGTTNNETTTGEPSTSDNAALGLDEDGRFIDTRTISVALWDRGNSRVPDFSQGHWAQWVKDQMLEQYNINIEWQTVSRWDEQEVMSTLLGSGTAPDVGMTFNNALVLSFAQMGGIMDLTPVLDEYEQFIPNLSGFLGEEFLRYMPNEQGQQWSITGREAQHGRVLTYIREDWLETLGLEVPTTQEEFENVLIAFRDRADELAEVSTGDIIPYFLDNDTTWDMQTLIESYIPSDTTERDWYIRGFDDRRFMFEDAVKEAARDFNRWFNEGLLWNDFVVSEAQLGQDQIRLGNVGAATMNWDFLFRPSEGFIAGATGIHANVGPEANFIPIETFPNDAGEYVYYMPNPNTRFIFFPTTNNEVLASLMYLDFMSKPETLEYLQLGEEGMQFERADDGSINFLAEEEGGHQIPDEFVIPSSFNFDLTITANGINDLDILQYSYPGITPEAVLAARSMGMDSQVVFPLIAMPEINAENGMLTPLNDARDVLIHTVITVPVDQFDATFDRMYQDYLNLGAQAIMDERAAAWEAAFGSATSSN